MYSHVWSFLCAKYTLGPLFPGPSPDPWLYPPKNQACPSPSPQQRKNPAGAQ